MSAALQIAFCNVKADKVKHAGRCGGLYIMQRYKHTDTDTHIAARSH